MRKLLAGLIVLAAPVLTAPGTQAAGFLGASWGRTEVQVDPESGSFGDSDIGWKVLGGFGPKYFGLEACYVDFGRFSGSSGGIGIDTDATGWDAAFFGRLPIQKFEIFGKVGLIYWKAEGNFSPGERHDDSGTDLSWSAGVGWTFGEHFGIRLEYERFQVDPNFLTVNELSMISFGVKYTF